MKWFQLEIENEAFGLFDEFFDANEEADSFSAIDNAVVIAQGGVHHWANDDFTVDGNRALLNAMHAKDAGLRWVEDWCRKQAAVGATIRDGEGAAGQVIKANFAVAGFLGKNCEYHLRCRQSSYPGPA